MNVKDFFDAFGLQNSKKRMNTQLPADAVMGQPESCFELINKYGTYEIQPTCDTENQYPCIAQGFNQKITQTDRQNKHFKGARWESRESENKDKQ